MFSTPAGPGIQRVLGDHTRARLRAWLEPGEIRLELVPLDEPDRKPSLLRLRPKGRPELESTGMRPDRWAMAAGLPSRGAGDVFVEFFESVGSSVLYGDNFRGAGEFDPEAPSEWMGAARSVVEDMAIHAVELCEVEPLLAARRFPVCMRWWLYRLAVLDGTGRIVQLTESAPGALLFAFALSESEVHRPLSKRLIEGVVRGRPLNALLGEVLDGWFDAAGAFAATREGLGQLPWLRLAAASPRERERLLADQRLLIRRASPAVPPTLVLLPPPLGFAPEDIPHATRANARWFRVMKGTLATLAVVPDTDPAIQTSLSRFASRNAAHLLPPRSAPTNAPLRRLVEYCIAERRLPSRRTSVDRLLAEERGWTRRRWEQARLDLLREEEMYRESVLPDASELDWTTERVTVRALRTVGEVLDEGKRMHHCVGSYASDALAGRKVFCHVECDGDPYTMELRRSGEGERLVFQTLLGPCNDRPARAVLRALEPWFARNLRWGGGGG